jgi:methylenetetrahydrofolate dehydrogenase (NADP+)/methenyltetrahydrofolate cyclohydrolase
MINIDWKEYKSKKLNELKHKVSKQKLKPFLVIIEIGSNPASEIYVRNKIKACELIGIENLHIKFEETVKTKEVEKIIISLNNDDKVNGIIIQLPLPIKFNENHIINLVDPKKDVDGLTDKSLMQIVNKEEKFISCTPKGILTMLKEMDIKLTGKNICLIGRSKLVGLPLMHLLMNRNATVTICHKGTKLLKEHTINADIIITAAGNTKNLITEDMVNKYAIIIDVAINKDEETGKLYGDADYKNLKEKVGYVSPVPGGAGQLTVLSLMENTIDAYISQNN